MCSAQIACRVVSKLAPCCTAIIRVTLVATMVACSVEKDASGSVAKIARPAASKMRSAPERMGIGSSLTAALLVAIDIDANSTGEGLPAGRGTHAEGAALYALQCASCHGAKGEGMPPYPRLVSAPEDTTFDFGNDVKHVKTVGNYWPYATTLYDYIHRTMPFSAPGSLAPNEVYALVAFLLAENGVIARTATMDARSLPAVRMPARARFVRDNRAGGSAFR